ncbi:phage tail tape measure protein [Plesiomonas shigelloides]|uniref:phage tail tape measure protein n=1 Tax=Plesiomonas shigelloides TaxID=703 RepID=UPI0012620C73|nr:phage tail tape measure protein [Plesiomonas shigelloides]KAB7698802.1 phage tail tape measure protein [Plesiomonas shigelloides]
MQELSFTMRLIDQVTKPLQRIQSVVGGAASRVKGGLHDMGAGLLGMWGSNQVTQSMLEPAKGFTRALRAVESLGASKETLRQLGEMAMHSSGEFGMSAEHIIESAYAIQSGMGDSLAEGVLPRVANAADIMAKATKASNDTATNYIASMYGIFQTYADKMGQAQWVEALAGKTAEAVRIYRTSGFEMASAFSALGSAGEKANQSLETQIAIMGRMQSMGVSGSVAATQFNAFISGIRGADKELGMSFTNADGTLQDTVTILAKLHKRFGDLSKVKDQNLMKKALGSDEAMKFVLSLITQVPKLTGEIERLNAITDMSTAHDMAMKQVDGYQRLTQSIINVKMAIGQALNPALEPLANKMADVAGEVSAWLTKFPNIARWLGYMTIGITSFTSAASGLLVLRGMGRLLGLGAIGNEIGVFKTLLKIFTRFSGIDLLIWSFKKLLSALKWVRGAMFGAVMMTKLFNLWAGITRGATLLWSGSMGIATISMRLFGFATAFAGGAMQLLMSPITLIIVGLALLAAGVYYVINHWEELKASIMASPQFQWLSEQAQAIAVVFSQVWGAISAGWSAVVNFFATTSPLAAFNAISNQIRSVFAGLWDAITAQFAGAYNWIVTQLNKLPGISLEMKAVSAPDVSGSSAANSSTSLTSLPIGNSLAVPRGGIRQQMGDSKGGTTIDQSHHIGSVVIHTKEAPSAQQLAEYQELQAG